VHCFESVILGLSDRSQFPILKLTDHAKDHNGADVMQDQETEIAGAGDSEGAVVHRLGRW